MFLQRAEPRLVILTSHENLFHEVTYMYCDVHQSGIFW